MLRKNTPLDILGEGGYFVIYFNQKQMIFRKEILMAEPKEKKRTKKPQLIGQKPDLEPEIQAKIDAEGARRSKYWRMNGLNGFKEAV